MQTGAFNALGMMVLRVLGLSPAMSWRPASGGTSQQSDNTKLLENSDLINVIVGITADDVCIGNSAFYISGLDSVKSVRLKESTQRLCDALNKVSKWVASDLLRRGLSMYTLETLPSGACNLVPFLEDVYIYMCKDGSVVYYDKDGNKLKDILSFLYYTKDSLTVIDSSGSSNAGLSVDVVESDNLKYRIKPEAIQLSHIESAAQDLNTVERSMYRYRQTLSRLVRWVNVDVGTAMGDDINTAIGIVSQAINSNSMSLNVGATVVPGGDFNDALPIVPNRKGVGKPELVESIPNFDIKEIADLDYTLGRVFLSTRFPKTYADFNQSLNETTVSLLRSDIRYARMVSTTRQLMEDTVNTWYVDEGSGSSDVSFRLTKMPSTEDSDVVETLSAFADFSNNFYDVIDGADTKELAEAKVEALEALLADTSNLDSIQTWLGLVRDYIRTKFTVVADDKVSAVGKGAGSGSAVNELPGDAVLSEARSAYSAPDVEPE